MICTVQAERTTNAEPIFIFMLFAMALKQSQKLSFCGLQDCMAHCTNLTARLRSSDHCGVMPIKMASYNCGIVFHVQDLDSHSTIYIYKLPTKPLMVATSCLACVCVCALRGVAVMLYTV
jgi:hypothetical protein